MAYLRFEEKGWLTLSKYLITKVFVEKPRVHQVCYLFCYKGAIYLDLL